MNNRYLVKRLFPAVLISLLGAVVACAPNTSRNLPIMGGCSQPRSTEQAPDEYYSLRSPLERNQYNIDAGERLFQRTAKPVACARCHGKNGDGLGPMANMFNPPPRDFTCSDVVKGIPEGQLFWVIKNGSKGTSMPAFDRLDDKEIWQLVAYISELAQ